MKKILVVEDEEKMRRLIKDYLLNWGYQVFEATNGLQALELFNSKQPDLVVLDLMIPKIDGYEVASEIKRISNTPIIMLTAKVDEVDELKGFGHGADDYIKKPFSPKLLIARIEALLKYLDKFIEIKGSGLVVDNSKHKVYLEQEELQLTAKEFILLNYMIKNKGIALTREQMVQAMWSFESDRDDRVIDTHIKRLRKKLNGKFIKTVHGYGYKFQEE